jgi:hypothetical protein
MITITNRIYDITETNSIFVDKVSYEKSIKFSEAITERTKCWYYEVFSERLSVL